MKATKLIINGEVQTIAWGDFPQLGTAAYLDVGTGAWEIPVIWNNGKLDWSIIPSVGVMDVYTVSTVADLTTLSQATQWDIAIVTTDNTTYILSAEPYSTLSNWTQLLFPTGAVSSVNWQTWAVTLTTNNISESNDKLYVSTAEKTAWDWKLDSGDVSTVALTGSYSDLLNKPVIDSTLSTSSTNAIQNGAVATAINSINNDISSIQTTLGWATGDITTIQWDITSLQTTVSGLVSDTAFWSSWDGDTTHAPSKNAIYDVLGDVETLLANL